MMRRALGLADHLDQRVALDPSLHLEPTVEVTTRASAERARVAEALVPLRAGQNLDQGGANRGIPNVTLLGQKRKSPLLLDSN